MRMMLALIARLWHEKRGQMNSLLVRGHNNDIRVRVDSNAHVILISSAGTSPYCGGNVRLRC